jgi:hypothetical protein
LFVWIIGIYAKLREESGQRKHVQYIVVVVLFQEYFQVVLEIGNTYTTIDSDIKHWCMI